MLQSWQQKIAAIIKFFKQYRLKSLGRWQKSHSKKHLHLSYILYILTRPALWLCLTLVIFMIGLGFNTYYNYYAKFMDKRLAAGFFDRTVDVYTQPIVLQATEDYPRDKLVIYLKNIGYIVVNGQLTPHSYQLANNSLTLRRGEPGSLVVTIEYTDTTTTTINHITDIASGQELSSYELPGLLLGTISDTERSRRRPVEFEQIPKHLISAILATEDRHFFDHPGVDYRAVLRALKVNFQHGEVTQGGSTITQQLIKTVFKRNERTYLRKVEEAFFAVILEQRLSKIEILTLYTNEIYLGQQGDIAIHGFGEAAQFYFSKDLAELSLAENAMLAGMICGPSYYSPIHNPEQAKARRNEVLNAMFETNNISRGEYELAYNTPLKVMPQDIVFTEAPYFFDYVSAQLQQLLPQLPTIGRFRTTVTLDLALQEAAEQVLAIQVDKLRSTRNTDRVPLQAALVVLEPHTGDLLALVGGRDYQESCFNRATSALRQPGSAFKPFVYASAFSTWRFSPDSLIRDEPQTFTYDNTREYKPQNYGKRFSGKEVTLRQAFAQSLNTATVALAQDVGLNNIADLAARAGLPKPKLYLSMALGTFEATPLQMAAAYGAMANSGQYISPRAFSTITTSEGKLVTKLVQTSRWVCSAPVAYLTTDIMQSVITEGTARQASRLRDYSAIAGKTGTSSDGWFIGYTPRLLVGVWVGYDDHKDLKLTGGHSALPIWISFMQDALKLRPQLRELSFSRPADFPQIAIPPEPLTLIPTTDTEQLVESTSTIDDSLGLIDPRPLTDRFPTDNTIAPPFPENNEENNAVIDRVLTNDDLPK